MAAEGAGLGLSIAQTIALLQTCLTIYDQISSLYHKDSDLHYLVLRTNFERRRCCELTTRLTTTRDDQDVARLDLARATLTHSASTLERLERIISSHSRRRDERGNQISKPGNKFTRAFKWIGSDKSTAERLVSNLKELNDQLQVLLPAIQHAELNFGLIANSVATTNVDQLRSLQEASKPEHPIISRAAGVKISRIENFMGLMSSGEAPKRSQITNLNAFKWKFLMSNSQSVGRRPEDTASLSDVVKDERAFAIYQKSELMEGVPVLVEWRTGFRSTQSVEAHRYRLDQLVLSLNQMSASTSNPVVSVTSDDSEPPLSVPDGACSNRVGSEDSKFGILPCLGWLTNDRNFSYVGLVFSTPDLQVPLRPWSLYEKIKQDWRKRKPGPPLGIRFAMAQALVQRVANLIVVGWVHKSIRSHNVLMFMPQRAAKTSSTAGCDGTSVENHGSAWYQDDNDKNLDNFYLTGFSYARPVDPTDNSNDLSTLPAHDAAFPLYRPPRSISQRQKMSPNSQQDGEALINYSSKISSSADFDKLTLSSKLKLDAGIDVYGLGVILLELAFWKTIDVIYQESQQEMTRASKSNNTSSSDGGKPRTSLSYEQFQDSPFFSRVIGALETRVGTIYAKTVQKCLTLDGWQEQPQITTASGRESSIQSALSRPGPSTYPATLLDTNGQQQYETQASKIGPGTADAVGMDSELSSEAKFLQSVVSSLSQCRA